MARAKKAVDAAKSWEDQSDGRFYNQKDVERIRSAAEAIGDSFTWDRTKEGDEYWLKVYERLREIADTIERRIENGYDERL